jgi:hypothetical protein
MVADGIQTEFRKTSRLHLHLLVTLASQFLIVRIGHHDDFFHRPNVIVYLRFHRWRHAQRLVNLAEVAIHKVQTDCVHVIL